MDGFRRFAADVRGVSVIEFAIAAPVLLAAGGYGIELSYYALCQLNVSQYALSLADNASRVGQVASNGVSTLRETDINDVLQATKIQGDALGLTTYGRVTLSSLENVQQDYDKKQVQRLHWQRCIGLASGDAYDSTYGAPKAANLSTVGTPVPTILLNYAAANDDKYAGVVDTDGMGDADNLVTAPDGTAVMFVEINYAYQPLFGTLFISPKVIHYTASLIVRDNRDFSGITNPSPTATPSTCDLHTAGPVTLNNY